MQFTERALAEAYRNMPDDEIASLSSQLDSLTEVARAALQTEIRRRGLNAAQLSKLRASEVRQEAKFDRRQKEHRKRVASYLARGDPKWVLAAIFVVLGAALIAWLLSIHH